MSSAEQRLLSAVLNAAGVESITPEQYFRTATPYASYRTAERLYLVAPDNCSEWHPDPRTTGFVVVVDLP